MVIFAGMEPVEIAAILRTKNRANGSLFFFWP